MPKSRKSNPRQKPTNSIKKVQNISINQNVKSFFDKTVVRVITLITLFGAYPTFEFIRDKFKTPEQKFVDEMYIPGTLSNKSADTSKYISVILGSDTQRFTRSSFRNGLEYNPASTTCGVEIEKPTIITLKLIDNQLFVSGEFKDFEHKEVVGVIKNNKWSLLKSNILSFKQTENGLVVLDRQKNVVINVFFQEPSTINVKGYFLTEHFISIATGGLNASCIPINDPKYKDEINHYLKKISKNQN